ncbi:hypothetical protein JKP88DRAFT_241854 [Tribonema minus]|uniref:Right handed beta helix domain-containing protein n=1 Tax=Tribonema minus TaxID=303371 RepID=A0A835YSL6_9STRA|nr:hypothetical protein JKP88DRAFT_241854 [Tribonema minus]
MLLRLGHGVLVVLLACLMLLAQRHTLGTCIEGTPLGLNRRAAAPPNGAPPMTAIICELPERPYVVDDTNSANNLVRQLVACKGKHIDVEWHETVRIDHTLVVSDGQSLQIWSKSASSRAVIDGQHKIRLLRVGTGGKVQLRDMVLQHGHYVKGGAIMVAKGGLLTVDACAFQFNGVGNAQATKLNRQVIKSGGAIYNQGTLLCRSSNFTRNGAAGGAVYNHNATMTIYNSVFTVNLAQGQCHRGYCVSDIGARTATQALTSSVFLLPCPLVTGCVSCGNIGRSSSLTSDIRFGYAVIIANRMFAVHTAVGGAIFNGGDTDMTVADSVFTNNRVKRGAIYTQRGANMTVANSSFANNDADCGAICNRGGANMTVAQSLFAYNGAYCGAIYIQGGANMTVANSSFANNTANDAEHHTRHQLLERWEPGKQQHSIASVSALLNPAPQAAAAAALAAAVIDLAESDIRHWRP